MSRQLSTVAQIEFDAQVKAAYQMGAVLRPHVRVRNNVTGSTCRFRRANKGIAAPRLPQSDVSTMNAGFAEATAILIDYQASDYVDRLDEVLVNFDERSIIANNVGMAIGRRADQMIIGALDAANASASIAASATGLTFDKLVRAKSLMDARAVPLTDRKLAVSARGMENLLTEAKFTSRDYVADAVIKEGKIDRLLGFSIVMIEDRDEGGLPLASTTRTCFAWDMQAVGLAIGYDGPIEMNYIPEKTSWLICQIFKAGAVAIDANGVIEIATVEG